MRPLTESNAPLDPLVELARCRGEIEAIDRRLIEVIAERVTLGQRTAELKRVAKLPILDPQLEAEVIRRAMLAAREHGLPEEAMRELFWKLVGLSRRAQEDAR